MKSVPCPRCGHDGPVYLVEVTDDYITLSCTMCRCEWAICAASDSGK